MIFIKQNKKYPYIGGFTLVELIVSVGVFAMVFVAASGAFLSVLDAYQKVTATRLNIDNLTTALESLVRLVKTGENYHCGTGDFILPQDCLTGESYFAFKNTDVPRMSGVPDDPIVYKFIPCQPTPPPSELYCGRIQRSDDYGASFYPITVAPPMLDISYMKFYVSGTKPFRLVDGPVADVTQPQVTIIMKGTVGVKEKIKTSFSIQTTITERRLDIDNN